MWLYVNSFRLRVCVCEYLSDQKNTHTLSLSLSLSLSEWIDIEPHTDTLYNKCKSTFQFSNLAKYGHGPPEDGFKGDRNIQGQILSVLVWEFSVLKCSEVHELEQ